MTCPYPQAGPNNAPGNYMRVRCDRYRQRVQLGHAGHCVAIEASFVAGSTRFSNLADITECVPSDRGR